VDTLKFELVSRITVIGKNFANTTLLNKLLLVSESVEFICIFKSTYCLVIEKGSILSENGRKRSDSTIL
jgi:hypothetical protein